MVRVVLLTCAVCLFSAATAAAQDVNSPQETTQLSTLLAQQTSWKFECEGNHCILNGDVELPLPGNQGKFFADQIEIFADSS